MKIGSELQFEIPDDCPEHCLFLHDARALSQGGMCFRCPVMNCRAGDIGPLIEPIDFRDDWAEEWARFFKDGVLPKLPLKLTKKED